MLFKAAIAACLLAAVRGAPQTNEALKAQLARASASEDWETVASLSAELKGRVRALRATAVSPTISTKKGDVEIRVEENQHVKACVGDSCFNLDEIPGKLDSVQSATQLQFAQMNASMTELFAKGAKLSSDNQEAVTNLANTVVPTVNKKIDEASEKLELRLLKLEHACDVTTEYESTPSSGTSTSTFKKPVCGKVKVCKADEFVTAKPTRTTDRSCKKGTACKSNQYSASPLTANADRTCKTATVCKAKLEYEKIPRGTGVEPTNRVCVKATVCESGQSEEKKLSATADRVCFWAPQVQRFTKSSTYKTPKSCASGKECYARVLVVAGGGGGGGRSGAGGGAGGLVEHKRFKVKGGASYQVKIGNGGNGGAGTGRHGYNGGESVFGTLKAVGGGGGGSDPQMIGSTGGSAGGGKYGRRGGYASQRRMSGDSGKMGHGYNGGSGTSGTWNAGGGGGAGGVGLSGTSSKCGNGGKGFVSDITGKGITYAGGGGGGSHDPRCHTSTGLGGVGGGGRGNTGGRNAGQAGKNELGGGGGGGNTPGGNGGTGGKGGTGVVVVKCCYD